ncbi:MAG: hypothetical protein IJC82_07460 [Firmicutes bacterium]|nr:hypothetical protein [Bacillota bacterium]
MVRQISEETKSNLDLIKEKYNEIGKSARMPLGLRIIKILAFFCVFVVAAAVITTDDPILKVAPMIFVCGGICLIVWLFLTLYETVLDRRAFRTEAAMELEVRSKEAMTQIEKDLAIPEGAQSIDILCYDYIINKDGKEIDINNGCNYQNREFRIFCEENNVCFANKEYVLSIPKEEIGEIIRINKKITIPTWHKAEKYNAKKYKEQGVSASNGCLVIRPYYSVQVNENQNILIPGFDMDLFLDIVGLKFHTN